VKCRSCGEDIAFVKMDSGKWMPVNGLESETYSLHLQDRGEPQMTVVTDAGACFTGRIGKAHESGTTQVRGREVHWATCPQAKQHRKQG